MKRYSAVGVAMLGCAVTVLSSCSSTSSPAPASAATLTASNGRSATVGVPHDAAAHRVLAAIALRRSDLPAGWIAKGSARASKDAGVQAAVVRWVGGRNTDVDKLATAQSPGFVHGNASVQSSVTSYRNRGDIRSDVAMVHNPKISACFAHVAKTRLAAQLPPGVTVDTATMRITPTRSGAAHNIIATGTGAVGLSGNGRHLTVCLAVAFITGPRIEADVDADSLGQPVPQRILDATAAAVARRASHGTR